MTLAKGTKLGRYEICSKIGEGGMGEVYRARDTKLNRDVAVKVLPAPFSADVDRLRRFEQEAQAASALNHPNILSVFDFGEATTAKEITYDTPHSRYLTRSSSCGPSASTGTRNFHRRQRHRSTRAESHRHD
ncbi:MAG: protein kinase domain-containing protein [Pyrinomonadaceae bacterium]